MAQQRFDRILAYVNRRRAASVAELCAATGASEATIRRDLTERLRTLGMCARCTAALWPCAPPLRRRKQM